MEIPPSSLVGSDLPLPLPTAVGAVPGSPVDPEPELDLEIDEDFLRRIREV